MQQNIDLMTAHELAFALNLSVETIWRYTREKKIPYLELGSRQYRYRLDAVITALANSSQEQKSAYSSVLTKYTYQDYLEMPEEPGYRFELIEGQLIKEPGPNVPHQRVSRRLQRILEDYFWENDPGGEVFAAPLDVTFTDINVVQPDVFYVAGKQASIIEHARIDGPPTLVIEILSPWSKRKDRLKKLQIYQQYGVQHYWLADPDDKTLECFVLQNGRYALAAAGMDEEKIDHPDFVGLSIDLKSLFAS